MSERDEFTTRMESWLNRQTDVIVQLMSDLDQLLTDLPGGEAERRLEILERQAALLREVSPEMAPRLSDSASRHLLRLAQEYAACHSMKPLPETWALGREIQAALERDRPVRKIAYLGREGSWSWQQARLKHPEAEPTGTETFDAAADMVCDGVVDAAVLPIDNSTAGSINEVYDLLAARDLFITESSVLEIDNHLLGLKGADIRQIREVRSHPQPLRQCADIIRAYGWETVAMGSTADAAASVRHDEDAHAAAIGSREAATCNDLVVLMENVNNVQGNQTRFVTVKRERAIPSDANRISLAFVLPHECGSLSSVLSRISEMGLNIAKIQSRPIPGKPWEYQFHLDFMGSPSTGNALRGLYLLNRDLPGMKLLGWYRDGGS